MLIPLIVLLLASAPADPTRPRARPPGECEDRWRLELSASTAVTHRVCVSPGIMTGLLFDHPVVVDLQDEERFVAVTRGRNAVSFVPPPDMRPGEQLRLVASLQVGEVRQSLTFALVAHAGEATHQVEIYHDPRTWQSLHDELGRAGSTNQRLSQENDALQAGLEQARTQLALSEGLRGAYLGEQLDRSGITAHTMDSLSEPRPGALAAVEVTTYLSHKSLAAEVQIINNTHEPWSLREATLLDEQGKAQKAVRLWPPEALPPGEPAHVFAEFQNTGAMPARMTLILKEEGPRSITVTGVVFPRKGFPATPGTH